MSGGSMMSPCSCRSSSWPPSQWQYRTIGKDVFVVPDYFSPEDLEVIYSPIHEPDIVTNDSLDSDTTFVRKNVVVLIVESFGREYIGALNKSLDDGRYKGYTPFVDSLIAHSVTFAHSFCNRPQRHLRPFLLQWP